MHFEQSVLFADKSRSAHSQCKRNRLHIFILTRHRLWLWPFGNYCVFEVFVEQQNRRYWLAVARGHIVFGFSLRFACKMAWSARILFEILYCAFFFAFIFLLYPDTERQWS